jgi:hypothetical protein
MLDIQVVWHILEIAQFEMCMNKSLVYITDFTSLLIGYTYCYYTQNVWER